MKNERTGSIDSDLASDPNYLAYKAQEAELKEKYMGKVVAFMDGELVGVEDDYETLVKKVFEETGRIGFLYKEIVAEEIVHHIRGPRLFRR